MATAPLKLEFHYYFSDETSHSMNAFIRNENEKDILLICKEVITALGLTIEIESEALAEGGLKNRLKFIGKYSNELKILGGVVAFIITIPYGLQQYENIKLDNEIKREQLRQLRHESIEADSATTERIINEVVDRLADDHKINFHKSNIYKKLEDYRQVTDVSAQQLNEDDRPIDEEKKVSRTQFKNFIIRNNTIEPEVDENAVIEIVSPVLKAGDFPWKGIYNGQVIPFVVTDQYFKGQVLAKQFSFKNGDSILCVLHKKRIIDDTGVIKISKYVVIHVTRRLGTDQPNIERAFKHVSNEPKGAQLSLFSKNKKK